MEKKKNSFCSFRIEAEEYAKLQEMMAKLRSKDERCRVFKEEKNTSIEQVYFFSSCPQLKVRPMCSDACVLFPVSSVGPGCVGPPWPHSAETRQGLLWEEESAGGDGVQTLEHRTSHSDPAEETKQSSHDARRRRLKALWLVADRQKVCQSPIVFKSVIE